MQDIQIREATTADKKAVLSIRDDVYSGRDYLPAFYDNFMTSPFTTGFVFLYKGKIVSSKLHKTTLFLFHHWFRDLPYMYSGLKAHSRT